MISVTVPRIIFTVLNFEFIIFNSMIFTYFCLEPLELNDILNFVKKNSSCLCHWKSRTSLYIRAYTVIH
jgi:hypothetical protein